MFRQSPRRNGRNKGLKIKHVLQISIFLGVSVWLLYQVHHSDDKKPSIPSDIAKKLHNVHSKDILRLGRKHLQPKVKQDKKETEEQHQANEGGNETEPEDLVHDHESEEREDMKHMEDPENENGEEKTETEHEQMKIKSSEVNNEGMHSDGGEEIKGKVNEKVSNGQNKVIVLEKKEIEDGKKMNPNTTIENMTSEVRPSVNVLKEETIQPMNSVYKNTSQDSNLMPSVDIKSERLVNTNSENSMNSNGEVEDQKEQESNENENNEESESKSEEGGVLEEEKEALTDLGTLPESGIGGSRSNENTAAE